MMGIDRFVRWKRKSDRPSFNAIRTVLEDYLGAAIYSIRFNESRFTVLLYGTPSFPFKQQAGHEKYAAAVEQRNERFFEVFVADDNIDIITRQTDEFTNVVAEGFQKLAARFWKGKLGDG